MKILGIDTSCDDTAAAILAAENPSSKKQSPNIRVLGNVVSSQVELHAEYGGVYPMMAKREHQSNLVAVLAKALKEAKLLKVRNQNTEYRKNTQILNPKIKKLKTILRREEILFDSLDKFLQKYQKPKIDAIAVTAGAGLEPCLWVGVNFAKALGYWWNLPIIAVNHVEAHLLANFLGGYKELNSLHKGRSLTPWPAVGLVVSGGHTELVLIKSIGKYKIIGETRDDAAGECFDKTARILGLGYPGGPAIAAQAAEFKIQNSKFKINLPRPMQNSKDFDFSFSGLKTAVLYDWQKRSPKTRKSGGYVSEMANEIQQSIVDVLVKKTMKAAQNFQAKTILAGGGVMANSALRHKLETESSKRSLRFFVPPGNLCLDNGAMAAMAGYFHRDKTLAWQKLKARANLKIA
ncbi:MAG: tRNA (adenosine(37)-N6)-threonylcarbamoyltransferase complex transferase subunit TsaD [Patescibacteria group bacterium]|nr:tRNA (adenosine(37)-N6)-threonylcarbamoyltransferase complex transferase subunit TsaD [Patescibacteria group bacterium]